MKQLLIIVCAFFVSFVCAQNNNNEVEINGYKLYYDYHDVGSSSTVIFEAGARGNSHAWQYILPRLKEEGISYLAYDRAGHGQSEESDDERTIYQIYNDLSSLIKKLDIHGDLILVGHSFGGVYQQYFASKNKKRVKSMVLIDVPHSSWEERLLSCLTKEQMNARADNINQFRNETTKAFKEESINGRSSFEVLENVKVPKIQLVVLYGGSQSWPEAMDGDCLSRGWSASQQMHLEKYKNSKSEISSESGHHVPMDDPELVVSTLKSLLIN